jgi:SAM-dependent methyltransferase
MDVVSLHKNMLADLGVRIDTGTKILDWGCGEGAYVTEARTKGFDCVGCDFSAEGQYLSRIEKPYRLPYQDSSFDLVVSSGVLEHCMDYEGSIAELARVMKPRAAFLHFFPPKWALLEHHIHVPLAGAIQSKGWLSLWARLGVRNVYQRDYSVKAAVNHNHRFLKEGTNYLSRREVKQRLSRHFNAKFCEDVFLRHTPSKARHLPELLAPIYGALHNSMVFGVKAR